MITKQQASEFIYELSQKHKIFMDLEHGKFYVNTYITIEEDILGDYGFDKGSSIPLAIAVWLFIKENINSDLLKEFKQIPVDVDMLEVGQTYKVVLDDFYDGCHSVHIAKYIGKKEEYYYFENRHTWRYEKKDLYQLWKMNKKESEKGIVDKNA